MRGEIQVAGALGFFQLRLGLLDLAVDEAGGVDGGLLVLPLGLEPGGLLLEVGELFFQLLQSGPRSLVLLLLEGALLDLELKDLALELIDLGRHRIQFHPQARRRFVHQVHRLVRQEAVADVTV